MDGVVARLGEHRYTGSALSWWSEVQPHGLVIGPTGSGKTHLLKLLAARSAVAGAEVAILDGKGGCDYGAVVDQDRITVHRGPAAVDTALQSLDQEVIGRFECGPALSGRPVLAIIDELAALAIPLPDEVQRDFRARVEALRSALARIAFLGRAANVHLWIGQQRPDLADGSALTGAVRDQLTARIGLGWISLDAARMAFGVPIEQLDVRPGHGWAVGLDGVQPKAPAPIVVDKAGSA